MAKSFNKIFYFLLSISFLLLLLILSVYYGLKIWYKTATVLDNSIVITMPPKADIRSFALLLEDKKLVSNAFLYILSVKLFDNYREFKAGRYRFQGKISPQSISSLLKSGNTYNPVVLKLTIPEGYNIYKISQVLAKNKIGSYQKNVQIAKDSRFSLKLGVGDKGLEGFLYPTTYYFYKMPSAKQAYVKMVKHFFKILPTDYRHNIALKGLSLYQAVIFASLIELETSLLEEKPLISEVIWNRLNKNMPLAIDAALIYGIKNYNGNIRWKHIKDRSNPYNTRIYKGLPPTPICSPTLSSLLAVVNPTNYGYYYYVLDPELGQHRFSKTLKEHNKGVRKLVQYIKGKKTK